MYQRRFIEMLLFQASAVTLYTCGGDDQGSAVYSCIKVKGALAVWRELQRRDASLRIGEKYALNRRASRVAARIAGALNIQSAKEAGARE